MTDEKRLLNVGAFCNFKRKISDKMEAERQY